MDDTNEKYPVCVSRNTRAALRRFLQPLSLLALLRARRTPWPARSWCRCGSRPGASRGGNEKVTL
jgi:hypothetical protein